MSLFDGLLTKYEKSSTTGIRPGYSGSSGGTTGSSGSGAFSGSSGGTTGSSGSSGGTQGAGQHDPYTNTQPIIISESTPLVTTHGIVAHLPSNAQETKIEEPTIDTQIEEAKIAINNSFLELPNKSNINNESNKKELFNTDNKTSEINSTSLFFDKLNESTITPTVTPGINNSIGIEIPIDNITEPKTEFRDTAEYIAHALKEVNKLISDLNATNEAKLIEKDEYREQKKHFAELEKEAEAAHKKMVEERKHAESMKDYLENELIKTKTAAINKTNEENNKTKTAANDETIS